MILKLLNKRNCLFSIGIVQNNSLIGILNCYNIKNKLNQAKFDIKIRRKYWSRWLFKNLASNLHSLFIKLCKNNKIQVIITRINNVKSIRLVEFFGFTKYNENYYILII